MIFVIHFISDVSMIALTYWIEKGVDILTALIPSAATALLAAWFLDKAFKRSKNLGDSLVKSGIDKIEYASGKMSRRDRSILFGLNNKIKPIEVCLCFLTGDNFFLDYYDYLQQLLDNDCKIKLLVANPFDSKRYDKQLERMSDSFEKNTYTCCEEDKKDVANLYYEYSMLSNNKLNDLCYLERTYLMVSSQIIEKISENTYKDFYANLDEESKQKVWFERISKTGDHIMQVALVTKLVEKLNQDSKGSKIEIGYYKDEYRIPMILAKYNNNDREETLLWTNMNAPVKETTKSVNVFGKTTENDDSTYITDVMKSFDYLFDRYKK
ncbi:MAG: hypothetical protein AB7E61_06835 [Acholeplasmataceae bacterium]